MIPVSETVLLELAKQAPQLCVLGVIVWRFIRTIDQLHRQMSESSLRCHDVQSATLTAINQHTEVVQALTDEVRALGNGRFAPAAGQHFTIPATVQISETTRSGAKEDK